MIKCSQRSQTYLQVYLAKWQETDVAVKVITQMQNLSSVQGVHPQDPVTMSAWFCAASYF